MRQALVISFSVLFVFAASFFVVDAHLFRGYYSIPLLYYDLFEEFDGDIEYSITINNDGTANVFIKNNDFAYYPIIVYTDGLFTKLDPPTLLQYANRSQFRMNGTLVHSDSGGLSCGTGAGAVFMLPYESFELRNIPIHELLDYYDMEMLIERIDKANRPNLGNVVQIKLYLPINSLGNEQTRVYSNNFSLPLSQIKEAIDDSNDSFYDIIR